MGIKEVLEVIRDTLAGDTELKSFCQANWAKDQTVFLGVNWQDPPDESTFPVIIIPKIQTEGKGAKLAKYRIFLSFAISQSEKTQGAGSITYDSFVLVEEFRELAESAIENTRDCRGKIGTLEMDGESIEDMIFEHAGSETSIIIGLKREGLRGPTR